MGTVDLQKSANEPLFGIKSRPSAAAGQPPAARRQQPGPAAGSGKLLPESDSAFRQMITRLLSEETAKVIEYLNASLPKEASACLLVKKSGASSESLKDMVFNHYDRNFQTVFNRYLKTANANRDNFLPGQTPRETAELINSCGGVDVFNTGMVEKQTTARTAVNNLELHAGDVLRRNYFASAFLAGDAICRVVKCSFRDNARNPKAVTDLRFCVNIPASYLVSPASCNFALAAYIIKERITSPLIDAINREIALMAGQENFNAAEFIKKITESGAGDGRYVTINDNAAIAAVLAGGFGNAVNALTSLLDESNLDFQFLENLKDKHHVIIRDYEDAGDAPDEHYQITFMLLDNAGLDEARKAYGAQIQDFENAVRHLGNLFEVLYQDSKSVFKVNDFNDLALKYRRRIKKMFGVWYDEVPPIVTGKEWNDISFRPGDHYERGSALACLARLRERISAMYEYLYPVERRVMEERLGLLEKEFARLDSMTDPSRLCPGLVIDLDVTSIKRKKTTLDAMAAVFAEFLGGLPEIFQGAAVDTSVNTTEAQRKEK